MEFFLYVLDGFDIAGDLEVDEAAVDADDTVLLDGGESVVRRCGAEGGGVFATDEDVVGIGRKEGFETVAPSGDVLGDVAATGHPDDIVDEGVAAGGEVAGGAEADDVVN